MNRLLLMYLYGIYSRFLEQKPKKMCLACMHVKLIITDPTYRFSNRLSPVMLLTSTTALSLSPILNSSVTSIMHSLFINMTGIIILLITISTHRFTSCTPSFRTMTLVPIGSFVTIPTWRFLSLRITIFGLKVPFITIVIALLTLLTRLQLFSKN